MFVFYHDHNSILVVNPRGHIRRLFTPFRVYQSSAIAEPPKRWVYVDEVQIDQTDKLLYMIGGTLYPYNLFEIKINF
jgi:hypothetical protein